MNQLLKQMENKKLQDPFDKDPPEALREPAKMKFAKIEAKKLEGLKKISAENFTTKKLTTFDFLDAQPMPNTGIIMYGGCFSNHYSK
jgi:hypothetical protein